MSGNMTLTLIFLTFKSQVQEERRKRNEQWTEERDREGIKGGTREGIHEQKQTYCDDSNFIREIKKVE